MAATYKNVIPTLIPNTTVQKLFFDGVHEQYVISPVPGFVLHDNVRDWTKEDGETGEEIVACGYTGISASCGANYDFETNPREFYTVPETVITKK